MGFSVSRAWILVSEWKLLLLAKQTEVALPLPAVLGRDVCLPLPEQTRWPPGAHLELRLDRSPKRDTAGGRGKQAPYFHLSISGFSSASSLTPPLFLHIPPSFFHNRANGNKTSLWPRLCLFASGVHERACTGSSSSTLLSCVSAAF